jgi:hypothetical protein
MPETLLIPVPTTGERKNIKRHSRRKKKWRQVEDHTANSYTTYSFKNSIDTIEDIDNNYSIEFSIPSRLTVDGAENQKTEVDESVKEESLRQSKREIQFSKESLYSIESSLSDLVKGYERSITEIESEIRDESNNGCNGNILIHPVTKVTPSNTLAQQDTAAFDPVCNSKDSVGMDCNSFGTFKQIDISVRDNQEVNLVLVEESDSYSTQDMSSRTSQISGSTLSTARANDGITIKIEKGGEMIFKECIDIDSFVETDKNVSLETKLYQLKEELRTNLVKEPSHGLSSMDDRLGGGKQTLPRLPLNQYVIRLILMSILKVRRGGGIYEKAKRKVRKNEIKNKRRWSRKK